MSILTELPGAKNASTLREAAGGHLVSCAGTLFPSPCGYSGYVSHHEEHTKFLFVDSTFVPLALGVTGNVGLGRFHADTALPQASRRISLAG